MSWKSFAKVLVFLMGLGAIGIGLIMPGFNATPAVGAPVKAVNDLSRTLRSSARS